MKSPIIIAEAGVNHNGSLETAFRMVEEAAKAGADYIKFQTFKTESLVIANCDTANYQKTNCRQNSQSEMLRNLELSDSDFIQLYEYSKKTGIGFLSTPFDSESIKLISSLNPDFIKIPSGEITNLPYLREIAKTHLPAIISTGMSGIKEIEDALKPFYEENYNSDKLILLHCTTQYPTPFPDVNLRAMKTLRDIFQLAVGYSDHTRGIEVPIAATALGAAVIEKHFTLSRKMEGPDHAASLEPQELSEMVNSIRNVALALGSSEKSVTSSEKENILIARRSIVASKEIKKGDRFSEDNLTCKRPASGISPMRWDEVIGKIALKDFHPDELISF